MHISLTMKTILISLTSAALLLLGSSCRVMVPVDPNTGEPSMEMMPENHTGTCGLGALCGKKDKKSSCGCKKTEAMGVVAESK